VNFLQKKLWIAWSKFRFLRLPVEKRARLEVTTDGRHLTFLLVSLYEAGYGVQVVGSPAVFRELICLRKSAPMPFVIGGKERECGISISDREEFSFQGSVFSQISDKHSPLVTRNPSLILLDYDYFSGLTIKKTNRNENLTTEDTERTELEARLRPVSRAGAAFSNPFTSELARDFENTSLTRDASGPTSTPATSNPPLVTAPEALRAPYFMHPSVYHRGLHKSRLPTRHSQPVTRHSAEGASHLLPVTSYPPQRRRRFRLGFFGTHDREFYTKHYHFPGMNRFVILELFLGKFRDRMRRLRGFSRDWDPCEMAVSIDDRGGDRKGKSFLSQDHYFEALHECDFVLSPPGWCMPLSHNLVEAMFCGAIPITNAGSFMAEPLKDGETCLEFEDVEDLVTVIERALAMDAGEVLKMRQAVSDYYDRFLDPKAFAEELSRSDGGKVFVNAEENSVPFVFPGKF